MDKILVVDDEIDTVRMLQKYLSSKKYDVYTATNGLDAIQKVKEVMPQIVLLDIVMPGMGGIETMQEIKKIDPKIVVTMVSALADEDLARRTLQLGADDYIAKPLNLDFIGAYVTLKMLQFY